MSALPWLHLVLAGLLVVPTLVSARWDIRAESLIEEASQMTGGQFDRRELMKVLNRIGGELRCWPAAVSTRCVEQPQPLRPTACLLFGSRSVNDQLQRLAL